MTGPGPIVLRSGRLIYSLNTNTTSIASLAPTIKIANITQKSVFLSLPREVRHMIYGEVYDEWPDNDLSSDDGTGISRFKYFLRNVGLDRVCREIYMEVAPYIYQSVELGSYLRTWNRFFRAVNPINISYIRSFTFDYQCKWEGNYIPCQGMKRFKDKRNRWQRIFLYLSRANVQAKHVKIYIGPCSNPLCNPDGSRIDVTQHLRCQVYNDKAFLKGIYRNFKNSQRIELDGNFDPLWPLELRRKLRFVLKTEGCKATLFEPESYNPKVDLEGCTEVSPGVYEGRRGPGLQLQL
ncbi:hypothetical protein Daesc_009639 [Daldinia eschscholtzii]|uniref:Uncharacterized protein n=1 Tax=Daldinia eschscholtzii TaxID=292717 RepID=A0AAX6MAV6_9PEZI